MGTPAYFTKGSLKDVEYYVSNKNPNVYTYQFSRSGSEFVSHGCELGYLFGYNSNWDETDKALANLVQDVWSNFAKFG